MLRHAVIVALSAIALSLFACGSDDSSTPSATATTTSTPRATSGGMAPSPTVTPVGTFYYGTPSTANERVVALLDSAFKAADGKVYGAVVLHNRNLSEAVVVQYRVTLVSAGADGPAATYPVVIFPDEQITDAFEMTYPAGSNLPTLKISVLPSDRWLQFSGKERLTTAPVLHDRAEGTIANPFDYETGPLHLSVVARDEGGGVIEAHVVSLDSIPAHGTEDFSVPFDPSVTLFQVFVSFADDFPPWIAP